MDHFDTNGDRTAPILTPDQRIRVFISSTLQELAAERAATRAAVESVRFTPVLFELGARPHPPRALYRAYLEQSDVFVGIYWNRYGWVAPGMEMSGLEDEYELATALPKLIYVKGSARQREPRLGALLERIGTDDVSYRHFETPEELRDLVADDLALLASERFGRSSARVGLRSSIPAPASSFIGREWEAGEVARLIRQPDIRLLTLVGPGGIGKTRLALEVAGTSADAFDAGAAFVSLASLTDPNDVPAAVAEELGIGVAPDVPVDRALQARLAPLELLLVLDNLEHVLDSAAPLLAGLLAAAPGLTVLATSRSRLRLSGEHVFHVPPLDLPSVDARSVDVIRCSDAVRLFAVRARASGWIASDADIPAIADIVRRLDGLPLAIELAAAQTRLGSAELMQSRLHRRLDLGGGPRDADERHRTLRSAIDWSYELLDPTSRRFFEGLSVFVGGFSLDAAASLLDEGQDVEVLLGELLEASLVTTRPSPVTGVRFGMLETIREYAAERLAERPERAHVLRQHIAYYADLADEAYAAPIETMVLAHMRQDEERDNFRAALEAAIRSAPDEGVRLAGSLEHLWSSRGLAREGRAAIARALDAAQGAPAAWRARALLSGAWLAAEQSDHAEAERLASEALTIFRELGDLRYEGDALNALGWSAERQGDGDRAVRFFEESYRAFAQLSDESLGVVTTIHLANWLAAQGDLDQARRLYFEALRTFERLGLDDGRASLLIHLGGIDEQAGDLASARRSYEESRDVSRRIENKRVLAEALTAVAHIDATEGSIADAGRAYAEAVAIQLELGDCSGAASSLEGFAGVALSSGAGESAARLLGAAGAQRAACDRTSSCTEAAETRDVEQAARAILGDERFGEEASFGAALGATDLGALAEGIAEELAGSMASVRP